MGRRVSFVPDSPEYQWDAVVRTFIEFKEAVHCAPSTLSGYRELVLAPVEFKWRSITLFCSHFLPDPRHQH
jgi:hypothetical protein